MVPKKVVIEKANRLYQLPPEPDAYLPERRRRSLIRKMTVLDLASFVWPIRPDETQMVSAAAFAPADRDSVARLKEDLAVWYQTRFGARLNPEKEIYIGGGTTSIIVSLAAAFVDPGDPVFVPDIGLPLYRRAAVAAGAEPVAYGINGKDDWRPDFSRLDSRLGRVARLLFLNSPHNPTGAELSERALADLIAQAARDNVIVVNDAAYQSFAARTPVSLMSVAGGKRIGVEVGSFSYVFGLPRLPLGYVVGSRDIISGLKQAARLAPPFVSAFAVAEALAALQRYPNDAFTRVRATVAAARAEAIKLLDLLELEPAGHDTIPFLWARIERRRAAALAATHLFRRGRILALPGTAFGESGEGFLRFSLTAPPEQYARACERVKKRPRLFKLTRPQ